MTSDPLNKQGSSASSYTLSDFKSEDVSQTLAEATAALYQGERRHDLRLEVRGLGIKIRPVSRQPTGWINCKPMNFSRGGALIEVDRKFHRQDLVWLYIETNTAATNLEPFRIGAEVRHISPAGKNFQIGLKFRLDLIKDMRRIHVEHAISRLEGYLYAIGARENVTPKAGN